MPKTPPPSPFGVNLSGLKVLVVDNNHDALKLMGLIIERCQASAILASSAEAGFLRIAYERPDVVVSDIGMPDLDGFDFMRLVRRLPPDLGGLTPALAVSGYAHQDDVARCMAAGYQSHLAKPVNPMQLVEAIALLAKSVPS